MVKRKNTRMETKEYEALIAKYKHKLSVIDGAVFMEIYFPSNFFIPKQFEDLKVNTDKGDDGQIFLFTEVENGIEPVYKATIGVIDINRNMKAKNELFKKKAGELKKLFLDNDLETLKTIEFTFKKRGPKRTAKAKDDTTEEKEEKPLEIPSLVEADKKETPEVPQEAVDEVEESTEEMDNIKTDGNLLEAVKEMTGED